MIRAIAFSLAALIAVGSTVQADEKPALEPGNYILYYAFRYTSPELALCLLKVEKKGGDLRATIVETAPKLPPIELDNFKVDGRNVDFALNLAGRKLTFEGSVAAKNAKLAVGSFGDDRLLSRGKLIATDTDKLAEPDLMLKIDLPEALGKADDPAALKEMVEKNPDSPFMLEAVLRLLRHAEKAKPEEAAAWIKAAELYAETHRSRFQVDVIMKLADALKTQKGFSAQTATLIEKAGKALGEPSTAVQARLEKILKAAYETDGKTDLAKQSEANLAKLELALDKEYLVKVPPFKPRAFEGRKSKSDRVAVLELFTGAQCPPCVAADVAFDALQKSFKPTDLVLIQYHLHIPGPDPLTNTDTETRADFYKVHSTPTALFNGKPQSPGGGGMDGAEAKFKDFQKFIDPLLEETTPVKITGNVSAKGDKLNVKVEVKCVKEPKEDVKLRLLLVEESVKYVGGNGLRFHHQVVRAMPGGAEGTALKEPTTTKDVEIDLAEVRKNLTKYLDDFAKQGEFPNPDRPLDLKHLRVIALVQDDSSKEILQALQLEVPETK